MFRSPHRLTRDGGFLAVSSATLKAEAPSSKPQAPEKLQISSSNAAVIRRRSFVWIQPDRSPAHLTRRAWNLELGASLELGVWLLELRAARIHRKQRRTRRLPEQSPFYWLLRWRSKPAVTNGYSRRTRLHCVEMRHGGDVEHTVCGGGGGTDRIAELCRAQELFGPAGGEDI